jgi:CheY-like chemotaxis protein
MMNIEGKDRISILHADDEPIFLIGAKEYLIHFDLMVDTAQSGKEALKILETRIFPGLVQNCCQLCTLEQ